MAYFNQQMKAEKAPKIKAIFKKYGLKGSIGVNNHSTLVVNISAGDIDFIGNFNETTANKTVWGRPYTPADTYINVNTHWYDEHFSGVALECIEDLIDVMDEGNHDNSDIQTDYFDIGFYLDLNIGKWNKPYICNTLLK